MKKIFFNQIYILVVLAVLSVLSGSCKYQKIEPASYPDQKIYMSTADAAVNGTGGNGIFYVNAVAVPGQVYRYIVDLPNTKFVVPLGIIRSGVSLTGDIPVTVTASTDTVSKLITSGKLTSDTQLLPATAYTLAGSVTVPSGSSTFVFPLTVDLGFLLSHPNSKYGIAVGISSSQTTVNPVLSKTIILIDTQFLIPTASFTSAADPSSTKLINFTNTSLNGVSYSWDFGDGSAVSTLKAPSHTYTSSGTYNVKLITTGATGTAQAATVTNAVIVI